MHPLALDARTWAVYSSILAGGVALVLLLHHYFFLIGEKLTKRRESRVGATLLKHVKVPTRVMVILSAGAAILAVAPISETARAIVFHSAELAAIGAVGWLFIALAKFVSKFIEHRYTSGGEDSLAARRVRTQTQVIQRIAGIGIIIVTIAVMLMTFPNVRQIGASMLASAGIAGLVAGIAARSTFASLIAGLQVALTQPIRLEDSVVVEGEWGWIEEIGTTYVVVRLWDLRRLIVPLTYFIEKPFQNWTRTTSDLLGTAMIYADYTVPVEEVRGELNRILNETPLWDRRAWGLQVTDLTDSTIQMRALMSASNASRAFDLRCYVRERLIHFLQDKYPQCLPTKRGQLAINKEELITADRG
jgi:small-conductance mechanosensitive channel